MIKNINMPEIITIMIVRRLDDDMRAAMAIDWIAREREKPGIDTSLYSILVTYPLDSQGEGETRYRYISVQY